MPKRREVIGGTVKLGLIKSGNQAKPLTYSEEEKKVVFRTDLEQMFKRTTPIDLDTQPTTTQQGLTCAQCECQLFLIPLVAGLEIHLFRRTNSEPHKCMYCHQIEVNMVRFAWAELVVIHLENGAAYGNGREAQRIHHRVCPDYLSTVACGKLVHLQ
jgi:hypothetical protein